MSKVKKCSECGEQIQWDEDIFRGEDGEAYHDDCVTAYPNGFSLFSLNGHFLTNSDDPDLMASLVLNSGEYIDEEGGAE